MRVAEPIHERSRGDRERLTRLARGVKTLQKVVMRAWIVTGALDRMPRKQIAEELGVSRATVHLWIGRYRKGGIEALLRGTPRRGRIQVIAPEKEKAIVEATAYTIPKKCCSLECKVDGQSPEDIENDSSTNMEEVTL